MKSLLHYVISAWLALTGMIGYAATEQMEKLAPEPTVNVVWVYVFFIAFIAVCVGIGWGVYRAERASKQAAEQQKS